MFLECLKIKEFNPKRNCPLINFLLQRKGKIISRCSFIFQIITFAVGNEIVNEMAEKNKRKRTLENCFDNDDTFFTTVHCSEAIHK